MPDEAASYEMPLYFVAFLGFFTPFMSEVEYIHQTFTDCVSNQSYSKIY